MPRMKYDRGVCHIVLIDHFYVKKARLEFSFLKLRFEKSKFRKSSPSPPWETFSAGVGLPAYGTTGLLQLSHEKRSRIRNDTLIFFTIYKYQKKLNI
jgi:hypothetical protein